MSKKTQIEKKKLQKADETQKGKVKEVVLRELPDLRDILADQIKSIIKGETTPAIVNAVTNASGKIISTVKLELEYYKMMGITPKIAFIGDGKQKKLSE